MEPLLRLLIRLDRRVKSVWEQVQIVRRISNNVQSVMEMVILLSMESIDSDSLINSREYALIVKEPGSSLLNHAIFAMEKK